MSTDGSSASAYPGQPVTKTGKRDDDALLNEMRERFRYTISMEQDNRNTAELSIGFVWGEQWPGDIKARRETDKRPVLTNNQLGQFRNQVVNDVRQNKPAIKVHPASSDASKPLAEVLNGLIRHIEQKSRADRAYICGVNNAVDGGQGYWRVVTKYVSAESFDQELGIQQIENSFCVYYDPDTVEPDYSDAKFCFVAESMSKERFKEEHPDALLVDWQDADPGSQWVSEDNILVVDYFRIVTERKTLVKQLDGKIVYKEDLKPSPGGKIEDLLFRDHKGQVVSRSTDVPRVEWFKCTGAEVLESYDWPGKYIPVVKIAGIERFVDGKRLTKGLVTDALDSQRMYNYFITAATESVITQKAPPWVMAEGQDEGYEDEWSNPTGMNPVAHYVPKDLDGNPFPQAPQRQPPAPIPSGLIEMANNCKQDMRATIGIYDPSLGQKSNETSGRAIMARERQGDNATFHFPDNLNLGIQYTGRILIDMIPHIYDTHRVVRIIGEDGKPDTATLNQPQTQMQQAPDGSLQAVTQILNDVSVGEYEVEVEVGPSYGTKRIEAANSMMGFMQAMPNSAPLLGDVFAKLQDWPESDKVSERLKLMLPPQIQQAEAGQTPLPPQVVAQMQQMQQGIQQLQAQLGQMGPKLQAAEQRASKAELTTMQAKIAAAQQQLVVMGKLRDASLAAGDEAAKDETDRLKMANDLFADVLNFVARIAPQLAANPQAMLADVDAAVPNVASLAGMAGMRPNGGMQYPGGLQ